MLTGSHASTEPFKGRVRPGEACRAEVVFIGHYGEPPVTLTLPAGEERKGYLLAFHPLGDMQWTVEELSHVPIPDVGPTEGLDAAPQEHFAEDLMDLSQWHAVTPLPDCPHTRCRANPGPLHRSLHCKEMRRNKLIAFARLRPDSRFVQPDDEVASHPALYKRVESFQRDREGWDGMAVCWGWVAQNQAPNTPKPRPPTSTHTHSVPSH